MSNLIEVMADARWEELAERLRQMDVIRLLSTKITGYDPLRCNDRVESWRAIS